MTSTRENGFESPAQLSFDVFAVEEVTEEHLISNQDLNESTSDVSEMFFFVGKITFLYLAVEDK